jgi:hypothetical protein
MYNKLLIKKLLKKGFKVTDVKEGNLEQARTKLGINLPQFAPQKSLLSPLAPPLPCQIPAPSPPHLSSEQ